MWKTLKEILPYKSKQSSASNFSPDQFNTYFSTIGNNLESHFPDTVSLPHMNVSDHAPFQFDIITQCFIKTELLNLNVSLCLMSLGCMALSYLLLLML